MRKTKLLKVLAPGCWPDSARDRFVGRTVSAADMGWRRRKSSPPRAIERETQPGIQKLEAGCSQSSDINRRLPACRLLERVAGIEPAYSAWKAAALPLSYTGKRCRHRSYDEWWRELDLNQRRLSQRIYSPSPLTTRASLHYSSGSSDQACSLPLRVPAGASRPSNLEPGI